VAEELFWATNAQVISSSRQQTETKTPRDIE